MFDRTANLANNQIINYRCDPAEKWLVLIGIAPGAPEVGYYGNLLLVTSLQTVHMSYEVKQTNITVALLPANVCSNLLMIQNVVSVKLSPLEL